MVARCRLLLVPWHLVVGGAFVLAFFTADESTFGGSHRVLGWVIIAAVGLRLAIGLIGPADHPLALAWRRQRRQHPILAWVALLLLVMVVAAALSGLWPGSAHSWLADAAAVLATVHIFIVVLVFAA